MALSTEEAIKSISSQALTNLQKVYPNLNFDKEIEENVELAEHIKYAVINQGITHSTPLARPEAPKLDEDFSKYFVINNLPKVDGEKAKKLIQLLIRLFAKKNLQFPEEDIIMEVNEATGLTDGCAFIQAISEESAKFAAAVLNGHQLDKNHQLAAV
jgi:hypothetical protein